MRYENGILTLHGNSVQLNESEIKGLEIYTGLLFIAANAREAEIVRSGEVRAPTTVKKFGKKGRTNKKR